MRKDAPMHDGIPKMSPTLGPRMVKVELPSCYGCPALRRELWNDAKGEHINATCSAIHGPDGTPKVIATYWRIDRAPPAWCPAQ